MWDSWRIRWLPLHVRFPTYWTVICLSDCLHLSTRTSSTLWQESGCLAFPLSQGNYKLKQNFKLCVKHNFSRIQERSTCEVIFYKGVPAGLTLSPRSAFLGHFSHLSYQGVPSSQLPVQISIHHSESPYTQERIPGFIPFPAKNSFLNVTHCVHASPDDWEAWLQWPLMSQIGKVSRRAGLWCRLTGRSRKGMTL